MKKLKYLIPIILSLTIFVTVFIVSQIPAKAEVVSGVCGADGDNLIWEFDPNTNTLTINGTGEMANYTSYSAPWIQRRYDIKTVKLSNGITTIGDYAFYEFCDKLASINLPNSITSIGEYAFFNCRSLVNITIPDSVTSIGADAFSGSGIADITIPKSLSTFSYAFYYCSNLTTVNISDGVTKISDGSFCYCKSLTSVTIPKSVTSIDKQAFAACNNLKKVYLSSQNVVNGLTSESACGSLIYYANAICIDNAITSVPSYVTTNYPYTSIVTEDGVTYTVYAKSKCMFGHDYSDEWTTNSNQHWHECSCGDKKEQENHIYDNACDTTCNTCGYTRTITHTYYDNWIKGQTLHWYECSVCGSRKDESTHDYDNACDTTCNTCEYTRTITHIYLTSWSSDNEQHWHECSVCHVKKDEATHTFDTSCDTECNTCGYTRTVTHNYRPSWSNDENTHWHECSVCGDKNDEASHVPGAPATEYTAQICTVCQYVIESAFGHTHRYSDDWTFNRDMHWHACAGCSDKKDSGDHDYDNTCDTTCNTCGYIRTITHTYNTVWSKNQDGHWHECSVCHVKKDEAGHNYDNACDTVCNTCGHTRVTTHRYSNTCDTSCNICGDTRTVSHNYKSTWSKSKNKHWHECSVCGHVKDEASHVPGAPATETTDQICTVCSYVIKAALGHTHSYGDDWLKDTENHWKECNCGEKSSVSAHTWNEGEITHEPTVDLEGEKTFTCTVCSATKTGKLDKLDTPPVEPDEPDVPVTPETPDVSETPTEPNSPDNGTQDKNDTANPDTPKNDGEKSDTTIIIVTVIAAVALLGCGGMAVAMAIILKKRR